MTAALLEKIRQDKLNDAITYIKPNRLDKIKDNFYKQWIEETFDPERLLADYEAERSFLVILEQKQFDPSTGNRVSSPKLQKVDGDQWLHMTRQSKSSHIDFGGRSDGQGGLFPMAGYSIEVLHDPYFYLENKGKKVVESKTETTTYTLDDLEGMNDDAIKALYESVAGKKAGRLASEKQREYLVENAN